MFAFKRAIGESCLVGRVNGDNIYAKMVEGEDGLPSLRIYAGADGPYAPPLTLEDLRRITEWACE